MQPHSSTLDNICEVCGKLFIVKPSRRLIAKYCSRPCFLAGQPSRRVPVELRFWDRVGPPNSNGCREWTGCRDSCGYGYVSIVGGRNDRAHRVAWQLANGRELQPGEYVCHSCDDPPCCEPSHLWIGDHQANQADKVAKGRQGHSSSQSGTLNSQAKLTEADVVSIRERYAAGTASQASLALEHGVAVSTIAVITGGRTWRHVGGPVVNGLYVRWQRKRLSGQNGD